MHKPRESLKDLLPRRIPPEREGSALFELHPAELPYPGACWLEGSLYLQDLGFDFFARCFTAACVPFDYFGSQRLGAAAIARLLTELDAYHAELLGSPTREQVFARYASVYPAEMWKGFETELLGSTLRSASAELRAFVRDGTRDSRCLWVLGM
jgi:hypothetical protein